MFPIAGQTAGPNPGHSWVAWGATWAKQIWIILKNIFFSTGNVGPGPFALITVLNFLNERVDKNINFKTIKPSLVVFVKSWPVPLPSSD